MPILESLCDDEPKDHQVSQHHGYCFADAYSHLTESKVSVRQNDSLAVEQSHSQNSPATEFGWSSLMRDTSNFTESQKQDNNFINYGLAGASLIGAVLAKKYTVVPLAAFAYFVTKGEFERLPSNTVPKFYD